ncbi:hypothetical protein [Pleionea sp. CnH1-48]|uniref:hypothetical protein n=1 Tax=Pleionea sp. CnH1-48 TaxID=2954494 RepID=UPI0020977C89|nr:hypothetical protein [Pleionea sp. CnH1-48]MCO7223007.1 hypothetical protein [Pleionea sp. CnH1-48]
MNKFILIGLMALSINAFASIKNTSAGKITKMYSYDDFGAVAGKEGSDVAVFFPTGLTECPQGVWLTPNAPGYKTLTSFLLTAFTTDLSVRFQVYTNRIWPDSSGNKLCQIDAIRFDK